MTPISHNERSESPLPVEDCICPILQRQMFDPVALRKCHHIFERQAINQWFEQSNLCPLCRVIDPQIFSAKDLANADAAKIKITAEKLRKIFSEGLKYKKNHPEEKEEPIALHSLDARISRMLRESEQARRRLDRITLPIVSLLFLIILYTCFTKETNPNYYL